MDRIKINKQIEEIERKLAIVKQSYDIYDADKLLSEVNYLLMQMNNAFVPSAAYLLYLKKSEQYLRENIEDFVNRNSHNAFAEAWHKLSDTEKNMFTDTVIETDVNMNVESLMKYQRWKLIIRRLKMKKKTAKAKCNDTAITSA